MTDILTDTEDRLVALGIDAHLVRRVLAEVRTCWAGQIYVPKTDPAREELIRTHLEAGAPPRDVARRVGVSVSTVRRRRGTWL